MSTNVQPSLKGEGARQRGEVFSTLVLLLFLSTNSHAQKNNQFTQEKAMSESPVTARMYDVTYYDLSVMLIPETKSVYGDNTIMFKTLKELDSVQIDLDPRMQVKSVFSPEIRDYLKYRRTGNLLYIFPKHPIKIGVGFAIKIDFQEAAVKDNPPIWDGGFSWNKDAGGNDMINTLPKAKGNAPWWPCKFNSADKPDSMKIQCMIPAKDECTSNGKLLWVSDIVPMEWSFPADPKKKFTYPIRIFTWKVNYPISPADVKLEVNIDAGKIKKKMK